MGYIVERGNGGISLYGGNLEFFRYRGPEAIVSGPADTGKTLALCLKVHLCACKYPKANILILRKTQISTYSTVLQTFKEQILGPLDEWPCFPYGGDKRPSRFIYDNGSVVWVSGLDKPSRVLSSDFDMIAVSQTEELALSDWEVLTTRTTGRAGHMPYAQCIGDCNPGHPSHWIRRRQRAGTLKVFEATHHDNPEIYDPATGELTERGKLRLQPLQALTGHRRQRLLLGLWAAPEGAIYAVFDEKRHKVAHFIPPKHWPRFVGVDPYGAYIAAVWLAFDPENKVLNVYREYLEPFGLTTAQHVRNILELSKGEAVFAWVGGGPSERQQRADFTGAGLPLLAPPITDVWAGIDRVNSLLQEFALVVHDNCENLLSEIESYHRKMKDGKPTNQIESKHEFHLLDSLRYAVAHLCGPRTEEQIVDLSRPIVPGWL